MDEEREAKIYELGFLLSSSLMDEEAGGEYANLKSLIGKHGGETISEEIPRKIPLAYTMERVVANVRQEFSSAYFGWIKFALLPEKVSALRKDLAENEKVIRSLIFRTVRESTISPKRFARETPYRRPPVIRKREESALPINKEEIDKEIEAMVQEEVKSL